MTAEPDVDEHEALLEFLYACPVGLIEIDGNGTVGIMNAHAMKHLLPLAPDGDVGDLFGTMEGCAPELRNLWQGFSAKRGMVCDGHRVSVDLGAGRGGREPLVLALTVVKLSAERGLVTITDVSQQVAHERRLRQAETWFASLIGDVNDYAVLALAPDGTVASVNASFTRQTGHLCDEVAGQPLDRVLADAARPGALCLSDQLCVAERDGWCLDESWQVRLDGTRYWCQRLFAAQVGDDGRTVTGYSVVLRDVARQGGGDTTELQRLLTCDHLTGAANRGQFRRVLEREHGRWQASGASPSLLLIDIDHFKKVNDTHGHPAGDAVLRQFADACRAKLRATDLFARIGGEEFAALLPATSADEAARVAEKLRRTAATLEVEGGHAPIRITASVGFAAMGEAGSTDALMALADQRLYQAKRGGRDRACGPELLQLA